MKLSLEQHAELDKMASYFDRLEKIAERMGVEIDVLVEELKETNTPASPNLRKNLMAIASSRRSVFRLHAGNPVAGESQQVNLSVIVNGERK